jgi:hypothetical protein
METLNSRHDFGSVMIRELGLTYDKIDQKYTSCKLSQSTIKYSFNDVDRLIELPCNVIKRDNGYRATYDLHCRYIRS